MAAALRLTGTGGLVIMSRSDSLPLISKKSFLLRYKATFPKTLGKFKRIPPHSGGIITVIGLNGLVGAKAVVQQ